MHNHTPWRDYVRLRMGLGLVPCPTLRLGLASGSRQPCKPRNEKRWKTTRNCLAGLVGAWQHSRGGRSRGPNTQGEIPKPLVMRKPATKLRCAAAESLCRLRLLVPRSWFAWCNAPQIFVLPHLKDDRYRDKGENSRDWWRPGATVFAKVSNIAQNLSEIQTMVRHAAW
jgi:hypothetical protein